MNNYEYQQILDAIIFKYGFEALDRMDKEDIQRLIEEEEMRYEGY